MDEGAGELPVGKHCVQKQFMVNGVGM